MRVRCEDCGMIFQEYELRLDSEMIGEYMGAPAYVTYTVCPVCGSMELEDYYGDEDEIDEDDEY